MVVAPEEQSDGRYKEALNPEDHNLSSEIIVGLKSEQSPEVKEVCFSLSNSVWAENKCDRTISSDLPLKFDQRSHKTYILQFNDDYGKVEHGSIHMTDLLHRPHEIHTEMSLPFTTVTHLEDRVSECLNVINKYLGLASEQEDFFKCIINGGYCEANPALSCHFQTSLLLSRV
jgi:hypothetical protein